MSQDACLTEAQLLALLHGALASDEIARIHRHLDRCSDCRQLAAALARLEISSRDGSGDETPAEPAAPLGRGASIGRYLVLELIGMGAMGTVYAAFDPELERKVALKLLRPDGVSEAGQQRLVREARAAARLSHPNVVTVHDVGSWDGQVFLTMELVEGETLREWQRKTRPLAELVAAYVHAGHGLSAAHRAGLVHRDFKPDNVLVDRSGRVRVTDFGLARSLERVELPPAALPSSFPTPLEVTRTGATIGTPAYMAPEQFDGTNVDGRSDQFSFCASLYEAVYGEKPYGGASLAGLVSALRAGEVRPAPKGRDVPDWLRKTLLRGLSVRPEDRFPSMDALLAELGRARGWRRRTPLFAATAIAASVLIAAGVVYRLVEQQARVCSGGGARIAQAWGPEQRAQVAAAFEKTGDAESARVFQRVAAKLDGYASRWADAHESICEATRIHGVQSENLLGTRMTCLDQQHRELRVLAEELTRIDARGLLYAVTAAGSLIPPSECQTLPEYAGAGTKAATPELSRAVERVDEALAQVNALYNLGQHEAAQRKVSEAVAAARATAHPPVLARALVLHGLLEQVMGQSPDASYLEAASAALRGEADLTAARAFLGMAQVTFGLDRQTEKALQWVTLADAIGRRHGVDELLATTSFLRGVFLGEAGDAKAAVASLDEAARLTEKVHGEGHVDLAKILVSMAPMLALAGRMEEALAAHEQGDQIFKHQLGVRHPHYTVSIINHGVALTGAGRFEEAIALYREAVALREEAYGKGHPRTALPLMNIGEAHHLGGKHQEALPVLEQAIAISRSAKRVQLWEVAEATGHLVGSLRELGRIDEGLRRQRALVQELKKANGEKDRIYAAALLPLAQLQAARGDLDEAQATAKRALAAAEAVKHAQSTRAAALRLCAEWSVRLGRLEEASAFAAQAEAAAVATSSEAHPSFADARRVTALLLLEKGDAEGAVKAAEEALAIRVKYPGHAEALARTRLTLARALRAVTPGDARAAELIREVHAVPGVAAKLRTETQALQAQKQ